MNFTELNAVTGAALSFCALLVILGGWLKWVRPRWRKVKNDALGARDALVGRDAIFDRVSGRQLAPAIPGIGNRMEHQEREMSEMKQAVIQLAETHTQLIRVNEALVDHEGRLMALENAAVERVVGRAESAAAWRAMEAAHKAEPPLDAEAD